VCFFLKENCRGVPHSANFKEMLSHPGFELWVGAPQPVAFTTNCEPLDRLDCVAMAFLLSVHGSSYDVAVVSFCFLFSFRFNKSSLLGNIQHYPV
jgi:hypothetical protein